MIKGLITMPAAVQGECGTPGITWVQCEAADGGHRQISLVSQPCLEHTFCHTALLT
jgi:hypothetical protein